MWTTTNINQETQTCDINEPPELCIKGSDGYGSCGDTFCGCFWGFPVAEINTNEETNHDT